jgi:hypothetical protein
VSVERQGVLYKGGEMQSAGMDVKPTTQVLENGVDEQYELLRVQRWPELHSVWRDHQGGGARALRVW